MTARVERLFAETSRLLKAGRIQEAEAACREILRSEPNHVDCLLLLGGIAIHDGRLAEALELIGKADGLRPGFAPAQFALGNALRRLGRNEDAAAAYRKAARLAPGLAAAHYALGNTLRELGQPEEAAAAYRSAIAAAPTHAEAYNNLGAALLDLGQPEAALEACRQAAALAAQDPGVQFNLGKALRALGRLDEAALAYGQALSLNPAYAEAHINLGNVLFDLDRMEAAAAAYRWAASLRPDDAEARLNLAEALQVLGETAAALGAARDALALDPGSPRGWLILSNLKTFKEGDLDLARMEALLAAQPPDRRGRAARIDLGFALGKAWTDAGDPDRAFAHLADANRLKRESLAYDVRTDVDWMGRIADAAWPRLLERFDGAGAPSELPIFIVGMPRSGTSLVEQILASHPLIHGAGELKALEAVICEAAGETDVSHAYPRLLSELTADRLQALGDAYVRRVAHLAADKPRLTDKMPANFAFAGLIALMLPKARIIHCRRDPVDVCFSCYSRKFASGQEFSYDLRDLGRYYRAYEALMARWRAVLVKGDFLEVSYEALVGDPEREARRLIAFCGLAWDEACLRFYETRRAVRTASVNQVRQPIYTASVERWRPFERHLKPLIATLNGAETEG
jgi:tetratricopeptide (TPR) repeat protein